ncbi:MAG: peptidoglycan editing factor PgeF [Xanthomonadales bacterium]|jgi:YfiH family protein|nr:peptidoglycan editing factor PgeF [Xanthomonadales bacterium]MCC6561406.1 peptidoglycan editing factor PgeF [Xanthomonadales bacterium]
MEWFVRAQWQAPGCVQGLTTTRLGPGVSAAPFDRLNLGDHVGDVPAAVSANRVALRQHLQLPGEPLWLRQVHGVRVVDADALPAGVVPEADAAITRSSDCVLAILTADCLPVLFAADDGSVIGAAHAGWRGLAAGLLEATVAAMQIDPARLVAWIGPAIRQPAFEVGAEVREVFVDRDPLAVAAFEPSTRAGHFLCDLALLARLRLAATGLDRVADCGVCTFADATRFYSHRRGSPTGRVATLLWRGVR